MYYLFSLLSGILISGQLALNGGLTNLYGPYSASVIIHIAGLILIAAIVLIRREHPFANRKALSFYLGGAVGLLTTVFTNMAFERISVSAILALELFAQSAVGLAIDHYGLLGMPKYPFRKQKLIGLLLILCGIVSMITSFEFFAVLVALLSGVTVIVSRTLNARLAECTSVRISTLFNYLVGLALAIPVYFLLGRHEVSVAQFQFYPNWYLYLGGTLGVCMILFCNMTVAKISALYFTLFSFLGQVFSGILIDALIDGAFSPRNLIGGVFVTAGLLVNLLLDRRQAKVKKAN